VLALEPATSTASQIMPAAQMRAIQRLLKTELVRIGIMRATIGERG